MLILFVQGFSKLVDPHYQDQDWDKEAAGQCRPVGVGARGKPVPQADIDQKDSAGHAGKFGQLVQPGRLRPDQDLVVAQSSVLVSVVG